MMIAQNVKRNLLTERSRSKIDGFHAVDISLTNTGVCVCVSVLARLSIFNVFYFLFVLLPLLLGVPFINNEVWIFFPSSLAVLLRYVHPIIVEFELNLIIQLNFWSQILYRCFPIPQLSFMVIFLRISIFCKCIYQKR